MRTIQLALWLGLVAAFGAHAQIPAARGPVTAPKSDPCPKTMTVSQRKACLTQRLDIATASLNTTNTAIRNRLPDAAAVSQFDESHDKWLKTMVKNCEFAEQFYSPGATISDIGVECRLFMTVDREKSLKSSATPPLSH